MASIKPSKEPDQLPGSRLTGFCQLPGSGNWNRPIPRHHSNNYELMPHFQKKMDLKLSVGVRYDAICIERLSQNRRTDRICQTQFSAKEQLNNFPSNSAPAESQGHPPIVMLEKK